MSKALKRIFITGIIFLFILTLQKEAAVSAAVNGEPSVPVTIEETERKSQGNKSEESKTEEIKTEETEKEAGKLEMGKLKLFDISLRDYLSTVTEVYVNEKKFAYSEIEEPGLFDEEGKIKFNVFANTEEGRIKVFTKAGRYEIRLISSEFAEISGIVSNLTRIKKGETTAIGGLTYKITVTDDENDIGEAAVIGVDYYLVTTVTIPAKISYKGRSFLVTTVAKGAFSKNEALRKVIIGENVIGIGAEAFAGSDKLSLIIIKSDKLISVGKNAVKGVSDKIVIKAPEDKIKDYKKKFKNKGVKKPPFLSIS